MARPLRFSINVTLDGCCDHRAIPADEELHRHATGALERADALIFGRATYPRIAGHGPALLSGLSRYADLKLAGRRELRSGAVALRYEPRGR